MPVHRMLFVEDDGVVTPTDALPADHLRKPAKGVRDLLPWRHIRLNVPPIGGDGNVPELPEWKKKIHMREHGRRVLCAEGNQIHNLRIEEIACDLLLVIGISDTDLTRVQTVHEPRRVERRNVRAHPRVQDHRTPPFFS